MRIREPNLIKSAMSLCLAVVWLYCCYSFWRTAGLAAGPARVNAITTNTQNLSLAIGKSVIVESSDVVKRVSVASPDIADTLVLTAHQIYVTGKASGVTTLTLWNDANRILAVFDVEVVPDVAALKEKIHQMFPGEKDCECRGNL